MAILRFDAFGAPINPAMCSVAAAVGAAASIAGGVISSSASSKAANTQANAATSAAQIQADAANRATDLQAAVYQQNRSDTLPWLQTGQAALKKYSKLLGVPYTAAPISNAATSLVSSGSGTGGSTGFGGFGATDPTGLAHVNQTPDQLAQGKQAYFNAMTGADRDAQAANSYAGGHQWAGFDPATGKVTDQAAYEADLKKWSNDPGNSSFFASFSSAGNPQYTDDEATAQARQDWLTYAKAKPGEATQNIPSAAKFVDASGTVTDQAQFDAAINAWANDPQNDPWFNTPANQKFLPVLSGRQTSVKTDAQEAADEFRATPGYQFQVDEATKAAERSAASRGLLKSGATLKAVADRAGNVADTTYENYASRLAGLAGVGQNAAGQIAGYGQNFANSAGNLMTGSSSDQANSILAAGQARASGYTNSANALGSALGGLANSAGQLFGTPSYQTGGSFAASGGQLVPDSSLTSAISLLKRGGRVNAAAKLMRADGGVADNDAAPETSNVVPFKPGANAAAGLIDSPTPGRADAVPMSVPDGAYVLPADLVSAYGDGNTMNGAQKLDQMFGQHEAGPDETGQGGGDPVDIQASGGEYIVSPETVLALGKGDAKAGFKMLDDFVQKLRAHTVDKMQNLPPPVQSDDAEAVPQQARGGGVNAASRLMKRAS